MREYGLEGRCKVYTDYQEGLKDPNVDIVVICTPNDMHCEQTILAAEAGKHILIEKPVALTWEDTKRMDEAVRKAGVKTLVGYVLHYNPLFVTAKKIQKDFIGELKYAETDYFHRVMGDIPCYQWTCKKSVGGSSLLAGGCTPWMPCGGLCRTRWCPSTPSPAKCARISSLTVPSPLS